MAPKTTVTEKLEDFEDDKYDSQYKNQVNHEVNSDEKINYFNSFKAELKWFNIIFLIIYNTIGLAYGVYSLLTLQTKTILYVVIVLFISGFGVTGGVHRYWTHRSFKAKMPLQIIFIICYSIAGQNTIIEWVKDHRVHHKYSETDADPHNVRRGFFFAHIGWLMMKKHPDVIEKGKAIDTSDVTDDPLVQFHTKYFQIFTLVFCYIIPVMIPIYFWNETFTTSLLTNISRHAINLNATWAVNSAAHLWGYKPYDKYIKPTENIWVSFMALGEGWHNYHHTFPWDYRASELGGYVNFTTLLLNLFRKIGWAYDLKYPSEELIKSVTENRGDGSHPVWGHHFEVPEDTSHTKIQ